MNVLALLENPYVRTGVSLFLALYAGLAAPKLPISVVRIFDNVIVRVAVLALIAYLGNRDPSLSLMVAIAFVVTLNALSQAQLRENLDELEQFWGNDDNAGAETYEENYDEADYAEEEQ